MPRAPDRSLRTAAALLAVDLGLRCFGYGAMRRVLARGRRPPPEQSRARTDRFAPDSFQAASDPEAADRDAGAAGAIGGLTEGDRARARRLAARVERSSSFRIYRVPCLARALLLERLLAARGLPARLCIGARRDGSALRAHAWVECGDLVLDSDPRVERRFPPLT